MQITSDSRIIHNIKDGIHGYLENVDDTIFLPDALFSLLLLATYEERLLEWKDNIEHGYFAFQIDKYRMAQSNAHGWRFAFLLFQERNSHVPKTRFPRLFLSYLLLNLLSNIYFILISSQRRDKT